MLLKNRTISVVQSFDFTQYGRGVVTRILLHQSKQIHHPIQCQQTFTALDGCWLLRRSHLPHPVIESCAEDALREIDPLGSYTAFQESSCPTGQFGRFIFALRSPLCCFALLPPYYFARCQAALLLLSAGQ
jgi:hypothetical protein